MKLKLHILTCFLSFTQIFSQEGSLVTVNTTRGTLIGFYFDKGNDTTQTWYGQGDVFLGIPYAMPPIGNLRYKQPRPIVQFPGPSPYNATYNRKACIQPPSDLPVDEQGEDCLYWLVMSPNASSLIKYAVMIWIHGGGLVGGTGHLGPTNIIRNLVSKGVVVASIDYRMGWLGFFTTFTDDFPPNLGMLDQVLALKLIKEEIGYFGGDSNKITLFGQSAGGHSVSSHTYSPLSKNLFQQAIMESGTVLTCYENSVGPTDRNYLFAHYACNYTQEMWDTAIASNNFTKLKDCLMSIRAEDGETAANKFWAPNSVCWNMVQDNYFLPNTPRKLAPNRPNIPVIIGTCKDETAGREVASVNKDPNMTAYNRENIEKRVLDQYMAWFGNSTSQAQAVLKIWEDYYLPPNATDDDHMSWLQFIIDVGTPAYFTMGALRDVEAYVTNNNPNVYTYEFAWSSPLDDAGNTDPNWHPVPHVCELHYLFGYGSGGNWTKTNQDLANLIQGYWANFAKFGKPTLDGTWKPTMSKNFTALEYYEFNNVSTQKIGYRYKDYIVWNEEIPKVLGVYPPNQPDNYSICSKGYQSKVKNFTCYEAFGTPLSWKDAQSACVQNSYGTLVSIASAFENSDLLVYAKNAYPSCTGFYTGLFNNVYTQNWAWVNYDSSMYRNWKSGSPSLSPSCAMMNANDGTWSNQACDIPQCYICSQ